GRQVRQTHTVAIQEGLHTREKSGMGNLAQHLKKAMVAFSQIVDQLGGRRRLGLALSIAVNLFEEVLNEKQGRRPARPLPQLAFLGLNGERRNKPGQGNGLIAAIGWQSGMSGYRASANVCFWPF
ncbi:MAG: hypothetical protein ACRED4_07620, partial [Brevundimonas sp.]